MDPKRVLDGALGVGKRAAIDALFCVKVLS